MGTGPIPNDDNKMPLGKEFWAQQAKNNSDNESKTWKAPDGSDNVPVGKSYQEVSRNNIKQVVDQQANNVKNILKTGGKIISAALGGWAASCTNAAESQIKLYNPREDFSRKDDSNKKCSIEYKPAEEKIVISVEGKDKKLELNQAVTSQIEQAINKKRAFLTQSIKELENLEQTKIEEEDGLKKVAIAHYQAQLYYIDTLSKDLFCNTENAECIKNLHGLENVLKNEFGVDVEIFNFH